MNYLILYKIFSKPFCTEFKLMHLGHFECSILNVICTLPQTRGSTAQRKYNGNFLALNTFFLFFLLPFLHNT